MGGSGAYRAVASTVRAETREKGSRFLAIVEPAVDEASTRARIGFYQQEYAAASHVCWAWRIGSPPVEGRSDAGEPAGTAGTPMLHVLRGDDVADVLAVVARWFGGVKLGKGGLARAYAGAVRNALAKASIRERRATVKLHISLPLDRVGDLKRLIHPPSVEMVEESYSDIVKATLEVERHRVAEIEDALNNFVSTVEIAGTGR